MWFKYSNFSWDKSKQNKYINFLSDKRIYNVKKNIIKYKIKIEIKTTTSTALTNELKYSPMSEGNTCIAESNLEVKIMH